TRCLFAVSDFSFSALENDLLGEKIRHRRILRWSPSGWSAELSVRRWSLTPRQRSTCACINSAVRFPPPSVFRGKNAENEAKKSSSENGSENKSTEFH